MAEDDWGDFEGSELEPKALAAAPVATHSRPLPADLFSSQEVAGDADDFGGFARAAAPASSPPSAHQHAFGAATAPSFSKGQAVSYFDGRSGSWVPAKVGHSRSEHTRLCSSVSVLCRPVRRVVTFTALLECRS